MELFGSIYRGKRVFVTGHTGFKGSWLVFWLQQLGADVMGFSLDIPSTPNHFELLKPEIRSVKGDIRNREHITREVAAFKPSIVFHLAAQSLVRLSYQNPIETLETNILGTANVFEACRLCDSVEAIVNITSDKCYENLETGIAYKETDRMGGYDPYSASKGCAELVANSFRNSFFNLQQYKSSHHILLASARAGNVIGGGDWAKDRLIPDIIKASVKGEPVNIRNPLATRPWQHVLEPLSGYLLLGKSLLEGKSEYADGWNFGPLDKETLTVEQVLSRMKKVWPTMEYVIEKNANHPHEASLLALDCSKANQELKWFPVWGMEESIEKTATWYKAFYENGIITTADDLNIYIKDAKDKNICWTS